MRFGIPAQSRDGETRVAATPETVVELLRCDKRLALPERVSLAQQTILILDDDPATLGPLPH